MSNQLAKYFAYLDQLRDSGKTNMWGSSLWLERTFILGNKRSTEIVGQWMKTYDPDKTPVERAALSTTRSLAK